MFSMQLFQELKRLFRIAEVLFDVKKRFSQHPALSSNMFMPGFITQDNRYVEPVRPAFSVLLSRFFCLILVF